MASMRSRTTPASTAWCWTRDEPRARRRPSLDRDGEAERRADRRDGEKVREKRPEAKLVYNNSSFNWTLKFREQVYGDWKAAGGPVGHPDPAEDLQALMDVALTTRSSRRKRSLIQSFQRTRRVRPDLPSSHHVPTTTRRPCRPIFLPRIPARACSRTYRRAASGIRRGLSAVKHQDLAGSNIGDDHKEYRQRALLAGGAANTMNF